MNTNINTVVASLSLAQLAIAYNMVASKSIKKFSDKSEAIRRTQAALDAAHKTVVIGPEGGIVITEPTEPSREDDEAELAALAASEEIAEEAETNQEPDVTEIEDEKIEEEIAEKTETLTDQAEPVAEAVAQPAEKKAPKAASRKPRAETSTEKKAPAKRGPKPVHLDTDFIEVLVENPKRKGSEAHARFALYRQGMTVAEFIAAGGRRDDLHWDTGRGFVFVSAEKQEPRLVVAASEPEMVEEEVAAA